MINFAQFKAWLAACGADIRQTAMVRFVPEGVGPSASGSQPVRVEVTMYCVNAEGKRYVDNAAHGEEPRAAIETRMLEIPYLPGMTSLTDDQLRALLEAYAYADNWPSTEVANTIQGLLDVESRQRGYDSWVEAHDGLNGTPATQETTG